MGDQGERVGAVQLLHSGIAIRQVNHRGRGGVRGGLVIRGDPALGGDERELAWVEADLISGKETSTLATSLLWLQLVCSYIQTQFF